MEGHSIISYVYDDIEEALFMSDSFQEFFKEEFVYRGHEMSYLQNGRFLITYEIEATE